MLLVPRSCFAGVALIFFPYRGTNSKTKHCAKAPDVDLLRLKTLRGTKTAAFVTPERYDEHRSFYMEVPPPPTRLKHFEIALYNLLTLF